MELNVNIKSNRANINMWSYFLRAEDRGRSSKFQRRWVMKPSYVIVWWIGPTDKIYPQPENGNCSLKGHTGKSSSLRFFSSLSKLELVLLLKRHKKSPNEWGVQRLGDSKLTPNGGWRFENQESNRPASQKSFGKTRGSSLTDNRTWVQSSTTMYHVASHSVICMCLVI